MTYREISFVFPLLNTIALSRDLEMERKRFVDAMLDKLRPFLDEIASKQQEFIEKHGERDSVDQPFRIRTKEQGKRFRADLKAYKNKRANSKLNAKEDALFEQLLWTALVGGYEDFPEI